MPTFQANPRGLQIPVLGSGSDQSARSAYSSFRLPEPAPENENPPEQNPLKKRKNEAPAPQEQQQEEESEEGEDPEEPAEEISEEDQKNALLRWILKTKRHLPHHVAGVTELPQSDLAIMQLDIEVLKILKKRILVERDVITPPVLPMAHNALMNFVQEIGTQQGLMINNLADVASVDTSQKNFKETLKDILIMMEIDLGISVSSPIIAYVMTVANLVVSLDKQNRANGQHLMATVNQRERVKKSMIEEYADL